MRARPRSISRAARRGSHPRPRRTGVLSGLIAVAGVCAALIPSTVLGQRASDTSFLPNVRFHAQGPKGYRRLSAGGSSTHYSEVWAAPNDRLSVEIKAFRSLSDAAYDVEKIRKRSSWSRIGLTFGYRGERQEEAFGTAGGIVHLRETLVTRVTSRRAHLPRAGTPLYRLAQDLGNRLRFQEFATEAASRQKVPEFPLPRGYRMEDQWAHVGSEAGRPQVLTVTWRRGAERIRLRAEFASFQAQVIQRVRELLPGMASMERAPDALKSLVFRMPSPGGPRRYLHVAPSGLKVIQLFLPRSLSAGQADRIVAGYFKICGVSPVSIRPVPRSYLDTPPPTRTGRGSAQKPIRVQ